MRGRAVVNEEDEYGNTPLHLAAWNSSKKAPPRGQQTIGAALTRIDGADSDTAPAQIGACWRMLA